MQSPQDCYFNHEKLDVYCDAIAFVAWLSPLLDGTTRAAEVSKINLTAPRHRSQLNIAEGNGKYSPGRSLPISRVFLLDRHLNVLAGLEDILVVKAKLTDEAIYKFVPRKRRYTLNRANVDGINKSKFDTRLRESNAP